MLILARQRLKAGEGSGWARTFAKQMEQVPGLPGAWHQGRVECWRARSRRLRVGDPAKADELGLGHVKIAYVTGDDLMPQIDELRGTGEPLLNLDTGEDPAALGFHP